MTSPKRILFLADVNSAHTRKWAVSLAEKGFTIGIFTLSRPESEWYKQNNIIVFNGNINKNIFSSSALSKMSYLKVIPLAKKAIHKFKPDILHAHYATSYGMIGMRADFHPYIISCWGSDVMDFPKKSFIHKFTLKKILSKGDKILATSKTIQERVRDIANKDAIITPFGIDTEIFKSRKVKSLFEDNNIIVGTIKSLEKIYCIDILIKAFEQVKKELMNIKLLIVGNGTQKAFLHSLVKKYNLEKDVLFLGKIDYAEISKYHNMIDVFVNISEQESFGVSVLEAMSCEKAVIVSDTGGLKDIVTDKKNGLVVGVKNTLQTVKAISELCSDKTQRQTLGLEARKNVLKYYDWNKNVADIIQIYNSV